jgi:tetratricopeptide (TPR) repeat protein
MVIVAAIGLFLIGGIGLLHSAASMPSVAPTVEPESAVRPTGDSASLESTIAALQAKLRAKPDDALGLASLGFAYVQQARVTADPAYYPKAQTVLERSLRIKPAQNFEALIGLGSLDLARHDFAGALREGDLAREANPYNSTVRGVIGDALIELGRYDEGFAAIQEMVKLRPTLASYARVSYARELQGNIPGALHSMRTALAAASSAQDAAWASNQIGELYWNSGHVATATQWYRRAFEQAPEFVPARAGLAKVAWARGDVAEAERRYRDVVERYPSPEYASALGDLYASQGDDDRAQQQYAVVQAERDVLRANGVNVDLELALFDADHGDPAGALAAAEEEWARRQSIHVADAYAWALHANGRDAEAAHYATLAMRTGMRNALIAFHAGMIQLGLGHDDAARALLQRAVDINPHFSILHAPEARAALAKLDGRS